MEPLTAEQIRRSFCNSSKSRVKSMTLPADLDDQPWPDLDFLGWIDSKSPSRAYLVAPREEGPVGIELRAPSRTGNGNAMCNLCHSARHGHEVVLYVAAKAGAAGKNGNSVGTYLCTDLTCSLNARGRKLDLPQPEPPGDARVAGVQRRVAAFVDQVLSLLVPLSPLDTVVCEWLHTCHEER